MRPEDFERAPCGCRECVVAGVSTQLQKRDPQTGQWLHGRDLARWYAAREKCRAMFKAAVGAKGMR